MHSVAVACDTLLSFQQKRLQRILSAYQFGLKLSEIMCYCSYVDHGLHRLTAHQFFCSVKPSTLHQKMHSTCIRKYTWPVCFCTYKFCAKCCSNM